MSISSFGPHSYNKDAITIRTWGEGATLEVGDFCSIAVCTIYLGGNHRSDWITTFPFGHHLQKTYNGQFNLGHPATRGNVKIGNDVWIAEHSTIMSGITIGDGAIIANNAHVVKDVEPYTIVGGNPARYIKHRFSKDIIDKLLQIKWWNWTDAKINENLKLLTSDKLQEFCDLHWIPDNLSQNESVASSSSTI
jgi:acetyltransferase-like isoleucine patch superfamily enzyme